MLSDRSYMRASEPPSIERASAVTILLVATIGMFVLQQIINVAFPAFSQGRNGFFSSWLVLSADNFRELKVWTVISYAFLHSSQNLLHIAGNMLGLFFIGRTIEALLGKQQLLVLYFSSVAFGGLAYVFLHLNDNGSVLGASAGVSGLLAFFCLRFPNREMTLLLFFILPIKVQPRWLFWGFLGISTYLLLFSELRGYNSVAHSAHLGGFFAGILYYRYIYDRQTGSGGLFGNSNIELPDWLVRGKKAESKISYQVNRPSRNNTELKEEVDRILDKINHSGFSSLSDAEKRTLDRAKDILK